MPVWANILQQFLRYTFSISPLCVFFFFNQQPEHIHPDVPSLRPFEEEFMVYWKLNGPGLTMSVWANLHHWSPPSHFFCRTIVCFFFPFNNSSRKIIRIYLRQGYSRRSSWSVRSYTAQIRLCLSGQTFIIEPYPRLFLSAEPLFVFFPLTLQPTTLVIYSGLPSPRPFEKKLVVERERSG